MRTTATYWKTALLESHARSLHHKERKRMKPQRKDQESSHGGSENPIRALGIAGSPRRRGNTDLLLDQFLLGVQDCGVEVERVILSRYRIGHCIACEKCFETGRCALKDDFQRVEELILASDVIVLAAPVYFWNLPGHTKQLVDRSESQWARKHVLGDPLDATPAGHLRRRGVLISTAGQPQASFEGMLHTVTEFFGVWETDLWRTLVLEDVDEKGAILNHPASLRAARELGREAATTPWRETI
jgi:multimeric flavodoxin WrbA